MSLKLLMWLSGISSFNLWNLCDQPSDWELTNTSTVVNNVINFREMRKSQYKMPSRDSLIFDSFCLESQYVIHIKKISSNSTKIKDSSTRWLVSRSPSPLSAKKFNWIQLEQICMLPSPLSVPTNQPEFIEWQLSVTGPTPSQVGDDFTAEKTNIASNVCRPGREKSFVTILIL